jgi:hypothetical protein
MLAVGTWPTSCSFKQVSFHQQFDCLIVWALKPHLLDRAIYSLIKDCMYIDTDSAGWPRPSVNNNQYSCRTTMLTSVAAVQCVVIHIIRKGHQVQDIVNVALALLHIHTHIHSRTFN